MKIHWHFDNPWRDRVIYVPLHLLVPVLDTHYQRQYGQKLDAYLLPQPDGSFSVGIRYGAEPDQYLSPGQVTLGNVSQLAADHLLQWRPCRWADELSRPKTPGVYFFRIAGDSESDGPHVYYDYPDYTQSGVVMDDEEGGVFAMGDKDEEPESIIAWYGPLTAPDCDCF